MLLLREKNAIFGGGHISAHPIYDDHFYQKFVPIGIEYKFEEVKRVKSQNRKYRIESSSGIESGIVTKNTLTPVSNDPNNEREELNIQNKEVPQSISHLFSNLDQHKIIPKYLFPVLLLLLSLLLLFQK